MILVGSQRGAARELARHLMKEENEAVVLYELRGFASEDLLSAFQESHAISRATRCRQHLYSLSLNPPADAKVGPEVFEDAVNRVEAKLGLTGQPRAIVFHEKRGIDGELRRHAHAVWCRIDTEAMRAIPLPHTRHKLQDIARELYIEQEWQMPAGFLRSEARDPRNYTLAEWQQAKRAEKDPRALKAMFQDCWAISDTQASLGHALKEKGYVLARGDRRGVVAVDREGEVYAIARWVGIKTKQVRARVTDTGALPDVTTAEREAAGLVIERLKELRTEAIRAGRADAEKFAEATAHMRGEQDRQRRNLAAQLTERWRCEEAERAQRIRRGWRGMLDRLTGRRRNMEARNRLEAKATRQRDADEAASLAEEHREIRESLRAQAALAKRQHREIVREIDQDIDELQRQQPNPDRQQDQPDCEIAETRRQRRRQRKWSSPER